MGGSAASKAEQVADALEAFLRDRPAAAFADPGQTVVPSQQGKGAFGDDVGLPSREPARQAGPAAAQAFAAGTPLRLPHPDWLFHRLVVTGSVATMAAFRAAASGGGGRSRGGSISPASKRTGSTCWSTRPIAR